jgi:glycosyltransferase involved in cell wall biosynthesis
VILLVYYNRPLWVRNAIRSVLEATRGIDRWRMVLCDDGSEHRGEPIVREMMGHCLDRVRFLRSEATIDDKVRNGITLGKLLNEAVAGGNEDICVTVCDDDQLHPEYLVKLGKYFAKRPEVVYCYSNIYLYNPLMDDPKTITTLTGPYNQWTEPIECYARVDGSQVAFRASIMREHGLWYEDSTLSQYHDNPWACTQDEGIFRKFYKKFGPAPYTGFVAQYKGVHEHQLVFHKEHMFKSDNDIYDYHKRVLTLAGEVY